LIILLFHSFSHSFSPFKKHTIGTFSWMQGVPVPSFAILHLHHSLTTPSASYMEVELCFMPNQMAVYLSYALLLALSIIIFYSTKQRQQQYLTLANSKPRNACCTQCSAVLTDTLKLIACVVPLWLLFLWMET
jgi:hypothetical protein